MGSFVPIAELFASLRLESAEFRAGLAAARGELLKFAQAAEQDGARLERLKVQIGSVLRVDREMVNSRIEGLRRLASHQVGSANQIKQLLSQEQAAVLLLQTAREEASAREKFTNTISVQLNRNLTEAIKAEGARRLASEKIISLSILAERKRAALVFKATEENRARDTKISADKRIATEKFAAGITEQLSRQLTASLQADTARRLAADKVAAAQRMENEKIAVAAALQTRKLAATQNLAIEKNRTINAQVENKKRQEAEQVAIAAALQARKLAATQAIALDQNRTRIAIANRRAETAATIESATIQKQVVRGLVLSSFLVAGRAGLVTGLIGVAGAATVATAGLVLGIGALTKEVIEFDNILTRSTANIKGMSDAMKGSLAAAAISLSNQFPISAKKIIESLEQTRQAGLDANQTMQLWPTFVKFSIAANAELGESIKTLVAIQRGFKTEFNIQSDIEAAKNLEQIATVVLNAARQGGQSGLEMAKGLAAAASAADKTSNSFLQVVSALTILGIKNFDGSRSGEILAQIMQRLRDESEQNAVAWEKLGVTMTNTDGTAKKFSEVMDNLATVIGTADAATNSYNSVQLGLEARTSKFIAVLLKEGSSMEEVVEALRNLIPLMTILAEKMDNVSDKASVLFNRFVNLARQQFGPSITTGLNIALDAYKDYLDKLDTLQEEEFRSRFEQLERLKRLGESPTLAEVAADELAHPRLRAGVLRKGDLPGAPTAAFAEGIIGFSLGSSPEERAKELASRKELARLRQETTDRRNLDILNSQFNNNRRNEVAALAEQRRILEDIIARGAVSQEEAFSIQLGLRAKELALEKRITAERDAQLRLLLSEEKTLNVLLSRRDKSDVLRFKAQLDAIKEREDLEKRAEARSLKDTVTDASIKRFEAAEKAALSKALRDTITERNIKAQNLLLLKQRDLEEKVIILRDQAIDGQANKFAFVMARIQAQAAKHNESLRILYGEDLENFKNLEEAKILIAEIAGQRQRQIINRLGAELESLFDRNILDAESFSDAMANIFNEIANHFKSMVFQMLAAWISGQSQLINESKRSGGFGDVIGILTSVVGGFLGGGGGTSAGLRPPVPFIRAPIGNTLNLDSGGSFRGGQPFLSGVPELIIPSISGSAVPLDRLGGTINNFIDARGADVAVVQRLTRAIETIEKNRNKDAVITTREMALRGFRV